MSGASFEGTFTIRQCGYSHNPTWAALFCSQVMATSSCPILESIEALQNCDLTKPIFHHKDHGLEGWLELEDVFFSSNGKI